MLTDAQVPGSDAWWLKKLEADMILRREGPSWTRTAFTTRDRCPLKVLDAYMRGDPPLPTASEGWAPVMREYLRIARMNLALLSVTSVTNKLKPLGFRTAVDNDQNGDQRAAEICKANRFNIVCNDVFTWMLALGDGYMMVGPGIDSPDIPTITAEHPFQTITSDDPITGRPRAALKVFRDEDLQIDQAYLFRPGYVRVASRAQTMADWEWDAEKSFALPDGMSDVIPVRRFRNWLGMGIFEPHLDNLDRLNTTLFQRVVVAEYQAFRMRIFAGLPSTSVDETGAEETIDYTQVFTNDPGTVVALGETEKAIQFFESTPIDLNPIRAAIQDDMKTFAAATSTPLHLITPDAAQGSAEGASLQREGGTWSAENTQERTDHPLAEIMSLAFRFAGDSDRTDVNKIETVWAPAERFSLAERSSAAVQAQTAGLPWAAIAQDIWQYSPSQIAYLETLRADDALLAPVTPAERAAAGTNLAPEFQQPGQSAAPQKPAAKQQPGA